MPRMAVLWSFRRYCHNLWRYTHHMEVPPYPTEVLPRAVSVTRGKVAFVGPTMGANVSHAKPWSIDSPEWRGEQKTLHGLGHLTPTSNDEYIDMHRWESLKSKAELKISLTASCFLETLLNNNSALKWQSAKEGGRQPFRINSSPDHTSAY